LWTFEELQVTSDLVVIAEMLDTHDTNVRTLLTDIRPPYPAVERNTEFKALTTLKGHIESATLKLRHYRTDTELLSGGVINGPTFVEFVRGRVNVYLLFLKQEFDGLFSPTSGQIDPSFSMFALPQNSLALFTPSRLDGSPR
jgi:hypothetical protein